MIDPSVTFSDGVATPIQDFGYFQETSDAELQRLEEQRYNQLQQRVHQKIEASAKEEKTQLVEDIAKTTTTLPEPYDR